MTHKFGAVLLVCAALAVGFATRTLNGQAQATQAQWEDQTAPEGAKAAGMAPERYREIRDAVHGVLQTLDFQGQIDGPMEIDRERAAPEMLARLDGDAYADLPSGSAAALQARLDRLLPVWIEYVNLTAVAG